MSFLGTEKKWRQQTYTPISVNATTGIITVPSTIYLKVRQDIQLVKVGETPTRYTVTDVISKTQFRVGPVDNPFSKYENPSQFNGGTAIVHEQPRNPISSDVVWRAIYDEEPAMALRNVLVDWSGNYYTTANPVPVFIADTPTEPDDDGEIKKAVICAPDVHLDFTWAEIDGVRRITQIVYSSAAVALELGFSSVYVQRDFTYQVADPFDLTDRQDTLVKVP